MSPVYFFTRGYYEPIWISAANTFLSYRSLGFLNKLLVPATRRTTNEKPQAFKKITRVLGAALLPANSCWHPHHALFTSLRFQFVRLLITSWARLTIKHGYCVCSVKIFVPSGREAHCTTNVTAERQGCTHQIIAPLRILCVVIALAMIKNNKI